MKIPYFEIDFLNDPLDHFEQDVIDLIFPAPKPTKLVPSISQVLINGELLGSIKGFNAEQPKVNLYTTYQVGKVTTPVQQSWSEISFSVCDVDSEVLNNVMKEMHDYSIGGRAGGTKFEFKVAKGKSSDILHVVGEGWITSMDNELSENDIVVNMKISVSNYRTL